MSKATPTPSGVTTLGSAAPDLLELKSALDRQGCFPLEPLAPEVWCEALLGAFALLPEVPLAAASTLRAHPPHQVNRFPVYALCRQTLVSVTRETEYSSDERLPSPPLLGAASESISLVPRDFSEATLHALLAGTGQERACPECWGEKTATPDPTCKEPCPRCAGKGFITLWRALEVQTRFRREDALLGLAQVLPLAGPLDRPERWGCLRLEMELEALLQRIRRTSLTTHPQFPAAGGLLGCLEKALESWRRRVDLSRDEVPHRQLIRLYELDALHLITRLKDRNHEFYLFPAIQLLQKSAFIEEKGGSQQPQG